MGAARLCGALFFLVGLTLRQVLSQGYTIVNSRGVSVTLIPEGATIQRLLVPDRNGSAQDLVLGFDSPEQYLGPAANAPFFGGIVGRVANRIAGATFTLGGRRYDVQANEGNNSLHSGPNTLEHRRWRVEGATNRSVRFSAASPAGDDGRVAPEGRAGFPGSVSLDVTYSLSESNELTADMRATATAPTPLNLAQHSYFNLDGEAAGGTILGHHLQLDSAYYLPVDDQFIPTGQFAAVNGTPFDFRQPHTIGQRIGQVTSPPPYGGYDNNFILFGLTGEEAKNQTVKCAVRPRAEVAATLWSEASGRALELSTNQPGLQFYAGNSLNGSLRGKGGYAYPQHGGFAIETQVFPNFVNTPAFAGCILRPGEEYHHVWRVRFFNSSEVDVRALATAPSPEGSPRGDESAQLPAPAPSPGQ